MNYWEIIKDSNYLIILVEISLIFWTAFSLFSYLGLKNIKKSKIIILIALVSAITIFVLPLFSGIFPKDESAQKIKIIPPQIIILTIVFLIFINEMLPNQVKNNNLINKIIYFLKKTMNIEDSHSENKNIKEEQRAKEIIKKRMFYRNQSDENQLSLFLYKEIESKHKDFLNSSNSNMNHIRKAFNIDLPRGFGKTTSLLNVKKWLKEDKDINLLMVSMLQIEDEISFTKEIKRLSRKEKIIPIFDLIIDHLNVFKLFQIENLSNFPKIGGENTILILEDLDRDIISTNGVIDHKDFSKKLKYISHLIERAKEDNIMVVLSASWSQAIAVEKFTNLYHKIYPTYMDKIIIERTSSPKISPSNISDSKIENLIDNYCNKTIDFYDHSEYYINLSKTIKFLFKTNSKSDAEWIQELGALVNYDFRNLYTISKIQNKKDRLIQALEIFFKENLQTTPGGGSISKDSSNIFYLKNSIKELTQRTSEQELVTDSKTPESDAKKEARKKRKNEEERRKTAEHFIENSKFNNASILWKELIFIILSNKNGQLIKDDNLIISFLIDLYSIMIDDNYIPKSITDIISKNKEEILLFMSSMISDKEIKKNSLYFKTMEETVEILLNEIPSNSQYVWIELQNNLRHLNDRHHTNYSDIFKDNKFNLIQILSYLQDNFLKSIVLFFQDRKVNLSADTIMRIFFIKHFYQLTKSNDLYNREKWSTFIQDYHLLEMELMLYSSPTPDRKKDDIILMGFEELKEILKKDNSSEEDKIIIDNFLNRWFVARLIRIEEKRGILQLLKSNNINDDTIKKIISIFLVRPSEQLYHDS